MTGVDSIRARTSTSRPVCSTTGAANEDRVHGLLTEGADPQGAFEGLELAAITVAAHRYVDRPVAALVRPTVAYRGTTGGSSPHMSRRPGDPKPVPCRVARRGPRTRGASTSCSTHLRARRSRLCPTGPRVCEPAGCRRSARRARCCDQRRRPAGQGRRPAPGGTFAERSVGTESSLPAALGHVLGERAHLQARHRRAQAPGDLRDYLCILEVSGRFHDRACPARWVLALEDP